MIRPARRRRRERERTRQAVRIWIGLSRLILRDHRLVLSALFRRLVCRCCAGGFAAGGGLDLNLDLLSPGSWLGWEEGLGLVWLLQTEADRGLRRDLVVQQQWSALEEVRTHRRRGHRPLLTARTRPSWLRWWRRGSQHRRSNECIGGGCDRAWIDGTAISLKGSSALRNRTKFNGGWSTLLLVFWSIRSVGDVDWGGGGRRRN